KVQDYDASNLLEQTNVDDAESSEIRPKKIQKIKRSEQTTVIESEDELSSQVSCSTASPPSTPLNISLQHKSQEQPNELCLSEDNRQSNFDQSLKAPNVKILSNTIVQSNINSSNISWVWDFMKKDKSKREVKCDVVTLLDGNNKKCGKIFSITTSTTHLGEHLNAVHRIFPNKQYKKNLKGQTMIDADKSIQTIPSMFLKIDPHKPAKQEKLLFRLTAWIVEDLDEPEDLEWPLLGDDDSETDDDELFELPVQSTST
ncbi:24867_t:CDS:2, partial [Gigaspora rosea]